MFFFFRQFYYYSFSVVFNTKAIIKRIKKNVKENKNKSNDDKEMI